MLKKEDTVEVINIVYLRSEYYTQFFRPYCLKQPVLEEW